MSKPPWLEQPDQTVSYSTDSEVDHPKHYNNGEIECIQGIRAAVGSLTNGYVAYCVGNSIKYLWRFSYKGKPKEDLKKAAWYLAEAIKQYE